MRGLVPYLLNIVIKDIRNSEFSYYFLDRRRGIYNDLFNVGILEYRFPKFKLLLPREYFISVFWLNG